MDTNALRLFIGAAEALNITAAGRALGLAPAVASARLAKLEKTLGADLLHRSTRRVSLSLEGAEFLPYAREIVAQEDAARAVLGHGRAQAGGTLRFTAPSTFAQDYIAPILPEFLDANPGVSLELRLSDQPFDLIEGSFDLALRNAALDDTSLKARKLAEDVRVLCAAPEYLARRGRPTAPEDLARHDLLAFREAKPIEIVSNAGARGLFDPRAGVCRLVIDDGLSQKRATIAGAGVSVNALWSVQADLDAGRLVRVLPDFRVAQESALWLIYPKANVLSAKVRVFMDYLIEHIGRAAPWRQPEQR